MSLAEQWCLSERRSLIGRPGATCTYATADWLSAVDGEYKKADATVMSLIGLGGLGRQTNRPELIEDHSFRSSTVPVPSFGVPRSSVSEVPRSRSWSIVSEVPRSSVSEVPRSRSRSIVSEILRPRSPVSEFRTETQRMEAAPPNG